jgi:predicted transcriptional regulator
MSETKTPDRHIDPPMVVYPLRLEKDSLDAIRNIAKKTERTRQSILREAIRFYLARRKE